MATAKSVDWWWSEEMDEWVADRMIEISISDQSSLVKQCLLLGLPIIIGCPEMLQLNCGLVNGNKEIKKTVRLTEEHLDLLKLAIRRTEASSSDLIRLSVRIISPLLCMKPSFSLTGKLSFSGAERESDK